MARTHSFYRYFPVSDRDIKWGIHVTTTGESRIPPNASYPPVGHPKAYDFNWTKGRVLKDFNIVYISSGRGWFESKHTPRLRVESGNAFLLFPGIWHRYMPDPGTGWTEHWIGIGGSIPNNFIRNGFFSAERPVFRTSHEELLLDTFSNIIEAVKSNQPAIQQVISAAACYILSILYSAQQGGPVGQNSVGTAIHEAIHLMNMQPESEIDLKALAQELNVSYTWFRRSFLQHTGLSPYQYLLQLRIARARSLLSDSTVTIQQAAYNAGFASEQYFCRLFKKKTGLTPGQWREQSRGEQTTDS